MLTPLSTLKSRLLIPDTDPQFDVLLTNAIAALSARFDRECHRSFARTENATHEFDADETMIIPACYPIESVTKFEVKSSEAAGWQEVQPTPDYLIRHACIISLSAPLNSQPSALSPPLARVTSTGGYVLPGTAPTTGQTPLPPDLENAAIEQVAFWFQSRDKLGTKTTWAYHGTYQQLATLDLLPSVQAVLRHHQRWSL